MSPGSMQQITESDKRIVTLDELNSLFKIKLFKQNNKERKKKEDDANCQAQSKKNNFYSVRISKTEFNSLKSEMRMKSEKQMPKAAGIQDTHNTETSYAADSVERHLSSAGNTYLNDTEPFSEMNFKDKSNEAILHKLSSGNGNTTLNQNSQPQLLSSSLYNTHTFFDSNIDFPHTQCKKNENAAIELEHPEKNDMLLSSAGVNASLHVTSHSKNVSSQVGPRYITNNPYKKMKIDYNNDFPQLKDSSPPFYQGEESQESTLQNA
ncbi:hypothetical protein ACO0QE_001706 [Hanseniaspora vineae]